MNLNDKIFYTIGHSNFNITKFIQLLKDHKVDIVVDVRSVPYSRYYPQFNKERLATSLERNQVQYVFEGETLGGRITDPDCYISRTLPDRKVNIAELIDYDELVKRSWFSVGIERLIELADSNRIAILCSEENPARCHRNLLVGRRLSELGYKVMHIRSDSSLEVAYSEEQYIQMELL